MGKMVPAVPLISQQHLIHTLRPIFRVVEPAGPLLFLLRPQQDRHTSVHPIEDSQ